MGSRLEQLPAHIFAQLAEIKRRLKAENREVIDLSAADPDLLPDERIITSLKQALDEPACHRHPPYAGTLELRQKIAAWFWHLYKVRLDSEQEILITLGSKDALSHLPLAILSVGDEIIVPEPAYPIYRWATILAGGEPVFCSLVSENKFLPDPDEIEARITSRTKAIFLNYPNNPTGTVASLEFYQRMVKLAQKYGLLLALDMAYSQITYEDYQSPSALQIADAKAHVIEFYSFSKSYSLIGWRLGFAVGNADVIAKLRKVKDVVSSGVFVALQKAAITALDLHNEVVRNTVAIYRRRRDLLASGLQRAGWQFGLPQGALFIWAKCCSPVDSIFFSFALAQQTGILVTPGAALGANCPEYLRFSLTCSENQLQQALKRLKDFSFKADN